MIKLLTPEGSKKPLLTIRNIRAVFYAIFGQREDWMNEQDQGEITERQLNYKRKIWKYKMMVDKLEKANSDALFLSSNLEFIENLTGEQMKGLTEDEKKDFVLRKS